MREKKPKNTKFKIIKLAANKEEFSITVYVNESGIFHCHLHNKVAAAIGIDCWIEASDYKTIEQKVYNSYRIYEKLTTKIEYRIFFKLRLSGKMQNRISKPEHLTYEEFNRKTGSFNSEYIDNDSVGFLLDWKPVAVEVKGKHVHYNALQIPDDENNTYLVEAEKEFNNGEKFGFWGSHVHKPYEGLILVPFSGHRFFSEIDVQQKYFSIPLTKETFDFFSLIEDNVVNWVNALFGFISVDENLLLQNITKAIQDKSFKQIGF